METLFSSSGGWKLTQHALQQWKCFLPVVQTGIHQLQYEVFGGLARKLS